MKKHVESVKSEFKWNLSSPSDLIPPVPNNVTLLPLLLWYRCFSEHPTIVGSGGPKENEETHHIFIQSNKTKVNQIIVKLHSDKNAKSELCKRWVVYVCSRMWNEAWWIDCRNRSKPNMLCACRGSGERAIAAKQTQVPRVTATNLHTAPWWHHRGHRYVSHVFTTELQCVYEKGVIQT